MNIEAINQIQAVIDKLEKAKEYIQCSKQSDDEMAMLALGYIEKVYNEMYHIKECICDTDND